MTIKQEKISIKQAPERCKKWYYLYHLPVKKLVEYEKRCYSTQADNFAWYLTRPSNNFGMQSADNFTK